MIVHSSQAADWHVWAAFAPLMAAVIAGLIAAAALLQKRRADNRAEWWRRAQWALDSSISPIKTQAEMGQKAIELLGQSHLATDEELAMLRIGTEDPLEAAFLAQASDARNAFRGAVAAQTVDAADDTGDNGGDSNDDAGR